MGATKKDREWASAKSDEPANSHGAMEEKGAYNRYAKIPMGGAALALPFLEKAVRNLLVDSAGQTLVIADYGSSQGKNSLVPMRNAIIILRERLGPKRPIFIYHVDLRTNDFNTLFEVLYTDPERYVLDEPNVYPCAIGKSFYENVFPPGYVNLAWCSFAAVWLSRIPMPIPGHIISFRAAGIVRAEFERQGAQDWETFLSLRASELAPGGRLVVVLPALSDDGLSGYEDIMDHANAVLAEMATNGTITADERARMVLGAHLRRKRNLLAPFVQNDGQFKDLIIEDCETYVLPDFAWTDYERHSDKDLLATQHARFFRSVFMPTLALGLRDGDGERRRTFADHLEDGLKRRLTSSPSALDSFVDVIVLAKQGGTPGGKEGREMSK